MDTALPAIGAQRAYAEVIGLYAVAFAGSIAFILTGVGGRAEDPTVNWAHMGAAALVGRVAQCGGIVWLAVVLARSRGLTIESFGLKGRPGSRSRRTAIGLFWASFVGLWVTLSAGGWLVAGLGVPLPQVGRLNIVTSIVAAICSAVTEEIVVVGTLVSTLRAARRPTVEIMVLGVVARLAYHAYYGLMALSLIAWAMLFLYLYALTRRLLPLIFAHAAYDVVALSRSPSAEVLVLGAAILATAAFLTIRAGDDDRSLGTGAWTG